MSAAMGASGTTLPPVLERLVAAMNARNVDAMMACCGPDYVADQPCRLGRRRDRTQVRETWTDLFRNVPDFRAELLAWVGAGSAMWTEWRWSGRHVDGGAFEMQGVIVFDADDQRLHRARLYMDQVVVAQEI
jgi:hypothetical protein